MTSTVQAAKQQDNELRIGEKESIEDFARRRYYMQMDLYSACAGYDLATQFESLPSEVQAEWLEDTKVKVAKENKKT
jgi:hypothetical protein